MTIDEVADTIVAEKSAKLIRYRKGSITSEKTGKVAHYDMKALHTGNKHGWTLLDATTAGCIQVLFECARKHPKAELAVYKLRNMPLLRLAQVAFGGWR